jgi:hypothetical protein
MSYIPDQAIATAQVCLRLLQGTRKQDIFIVVAGCLFEFKFADLLLRRYITAVPAAASMC